MTTVELPAATGTSSSDTEQQAADDRQTYQAVRRAFRPRRRIAATIVAAVLAIGSLLVAAEIFSRVFDRPLGALPVDWLAGLGRDTAWTGPLAVILALVAIGVGLLLLWLALSPGRPRVVPLRSGRADVLIGLTTAGLRRQAARAAESVDGVARTHVTGRERLAVQVHTPLRDPGDLADRTLDAVADRMEALAPVRLPRLRVSIKRRED